MKSLNLTIILLFCYFCSFAQQYVPMPTGEVQWRYRRIFNPPSYPTTDYHDFLLVQTGGDTIFGGVTYKKIMWRERDTKVVKTSTYIPPIQSVVANQTDRFYLAIREDNKKVYVNSGNGEKLMFDFTAAVGDTLPYHNFYNWPDTQLVVTSIDSVQIGATFHKRYNADRISNFGGSISIIEGIGTDLGLIGYLYTPYCYCSYTFHCFSDGNTSYVPNAPCAYIWPQGTPTNVDDVKEKTDIFVFPNPFQDKLTIETTQSVSIFLYNLTGQLVLKQNLRNTSTIQTSHLPSGIYLLKLTGSSSNIVETRKLVKE